MDDDREAHLEHLLATASIERAAITALVAAGCTSLRLGVPQVVPRLRYRDGQVVALDPQGRERFGFDGRPLGAESIVAELRDDRL